MDEQNNSPNQSEPDNAADLIRQKVARLYSAEPDAREEMAKTFSPRDALSKHQQFMKKLRQNYSDVVTIQTKWHEYYAGLSDKEKYEVWQEFYASQPVLNPATTLSNDTSADAHQLAQHKQSIIKKPRPKSKKTKKPTKAEVQNKIKQKISNNGRLKAKHHLQSLLFGLSLGFFVVFIFLFGFFNQIIIAPFIQPSRASASTPIILSTDAIAPSPTPEVIIPKIDVQIPVDYSETSTNENVIENDLEKGVVHYPTTVLPGQDGNTAFFGHSSNNIFNPGKYKFAFVLLHTLVDGDTFYLTYNDKVYVYKVISKTIVSPSDVSVLGPVAGQTATATLITCDPPGTSINRLIVVGTQISPNPSTNQVVATSESQSPPPKALPTDGQTLFGRLTSNKVSETIFVIVSLAIIIAFILIINRYLKSQKKLQKA